MLKKLKEFSVLGKLKSIGNLRFIEFQEGDLYSKMAQFAIQGYFDKGDIAFIVTIIKR